MARLRRVLSLLAALSLGLLLSSCILVDSPLSVVLSISPPTLTVTRYNTQAPPTGVPPPPPVEGAKPAPLVVPVVPVVPEGVAPP